MYGKQRQRYKQLVYFLILAVGVIFLLVAVFFNNSISQSFFLNLSTELIGVVGVFFLLNYFFFAEEERPFLRGISDLDNLEEEAPEAKDIAILAYSPARLVDRYLEYFTKRVRAGARLRILMTEPNSPSGELITSNSQDQDQHGLAEKVISLANLIARQAPEGEIEVRCINWIPSCSMIMLDPYTPKSYVMVTIYPPFPGSLKADRPHFVLNKQEHAHWNQNFVSQFEKLWNTGKLVGLN